MGWIPTDTFAARLMLVRHGLRLTLREAAARCDLSLRTWASWESGRRPQHVLAVVTAISEGLGVDRDWLAWGNRRGGD